MPDLAAKRVEVLTELLPGLARLGFLGSTRDTAANSFVRHITDAAERKSIGLHVELISGPEDFEQAFERMAKDRVQAVVVQPLFTLDPPVAARVSPHPGHLRLRDLCTRGRFSGLRTSPGRRATPLGKVRKAGSERGQPRRSPRNPADHFVLVVNLKVASALGVQVPPSILLRADEVIE